MFRFYRSLVLVLTVYEVSPSSIIARNNIIQTAPPAVKYGVNYDAFDGFAGLNERPKTIFC